MGWAAESAGRFLRRGGQTLLLLVLWAVVAGAVEIPARPANYVTDLAGVVDGGTEAALNGLLRELEEKTTVQFAVLTIPSLDGRPVEDLSIEIAHDRWKLGRKGEDNGLLLLVAVKDRKYRIEVGYGLEGLLPDSLAGSLGREYLVPHFRAGDYGRGIGSACLEITRRIAEDAGVELRGLTGKTAPPGDHRAGPRKKKRSGWFGILVLIVMAYLFIRHPRLFLLFMLTSGMGGRGRYGGGFGGHGGSFGGGMGGGFGGGGASGGW